MEKLIRLWGRWPGNLDDWLDRVALRMKGEQKTHRKSRRPTEAGTAFPISAAEARGGRPTKDPFKTTKPQRECRG